MVGITIWISVKILNEYLHFGSFLSSLKLSSEPHGLRSFCSGMELFIRSLALRRFSSCPALQQEKLCEDA